MQFFKGFFGAEAFDFGVKTFVFVLISKRRSSHQVKCQEEGDEEIWQT